MSINKKTPKTEKVHKYKGYTVKEKWLLCLLLSFFAPFLVLFYGPFEIYGNNMNEFMFVIWDFWPLCAIGAIVLTGVIFALFMLLRARAFDVFFGLVFGFSVMLFLQGNYLNIGAESLAGDGVGQALSSTKTTVNIIVWILVIAGCVAVMLLFNKYKDAIRTVATVVTVALIGMTVISFTVISLTSNVYVTEKQIETEQGENTGNEVLTVQNLDTLATDNNIIVFIVDRFDYSCYDEAMNVCPEIFKELEGFIHFDDYITRYPRTYPGVPHIVTGVEMDFSSTRPEYMRKAYSESPIWKELHDKGFDINLYTDSFYGYDNATYMKEFVSNISGDVLFEIINKPNLTFDMVRVSLYRYLPFALRDKIGIVSTPMFNKYVSYTTDEDKFTTDMKKVYNELTDKDFTFRESEKGVSYIHIEGCHTPNTYGPDFGTVKPGERDDVTVGMKQSFKIISEYIKEMKRMGVYEKSTIIILGDHSAIGSDTSLPNKVHITSLLAKPSGVYEGSVKESIAQIAPENIFATILNAAGSDKAKDYGESIFELPENQNRVRKYYFQMAHGNIFEGGFKNAKYEIVGPGNDMKNWKLVSAENMDKRLYD